MAGNLTLPINMLVNVSIEYQANLLSRDAFNRLCIIGSGVNTRGTPHGVYTSLAGVGGDYAESANEYKIAKKYFAQNPKPRDVLIATVDSITPAL